MTRCRVWYQIVPTAPSTLHKELVFFVLLVTFFGGGGSEGSQGKGRGITFSKVCPYEPLFICILDSFILPWRPFISEGRGWRKKQYGAKINHLHQVIYMYIHRFVNRQVAPHHVHFNGQPLLTWSCWVLFYMSIFLISKNLKKLPSENKVFFSFLLFIHNRRLWRLGILGFQVAPLQPSKCTHTEGERENYEGRQAW